MGEWGIGNGHLLLITPIDSSQSGNHQKKVYIFEIHDSINFLYSIFYQCINAKFTKSSSDNIFSTDIAIWM